MTDKMPDRIYLYESEKDGIVWSECTPSGLDGEYTRTDFFYKTCRSLLKPTDTDGTATNVLNQKYNEALMDLGRFLRGDNE